jgi:sigma-B regulation protein RsbU (phosphoserine phosphatase)
MAYLQSLKGLPSEVVPLAKDRLLIGRLPECDLTVPSQAISRAHAAIVREGNSYFIEDLQSRNGTFVNGERVLGRRLLQDRDVVSLGKVVVFEFRATGEVTSAQREPQILSVMDTRSVAALTLVSPEAKLRALLEIVNCIGGALDLDEALQRILVALFRIFPQADRGLILLCGDRPGQLHVKAVHGRRGEPDITPFSTTIVRRAIERRESILSADALDDSAFDASQSIAQLHIRSVMCVPLLASDQQPLGAVELHTETQRGQFTREDLELLAAVASAAAVTVENAQLHRKLLAKERVERELELAWDVQRSFLPHSSPRIAGYSFYTFYEPARVIGGDYYDFVSLGPENLLCIVGDVCGKGMPAALLMARVCSEVRAHCPQSRDPADLLHRVNQALCSSPIEERFITLLALELQTTTHEIRFANAAHLLPIRRRADGSVELLGRGKVGLPLGIEPSAPYWTVSDRLEPGDCVVLLTDGITDATDERGETFGLEAVLEAIRQSPPSPAEIGAAVLGAVRQHAGAAPIFDDQALLCIMRAA